MKTIAAGLILLAVFSPLVYANRDEGMLPADGFFLPKGDAEAGQRAFARLKCNSCHQTISDIDLNNPVAASKGPVLGTRQARYSEGWIANSIVSPSHTIAFDSQGNAENSDLSRMGDFKSVMTVQELIDITAYIQSLDVEKVD